MSVGSGAAVEARLAATAVADRAAYCFPGALTEMELSFMIWKNASL